jgi:hypothetical protein
VKVSDRSIRSRSIDAFAMLSNLIARLDDPTFSATNVIRWSCPVPSFGDFSGALVGTLGLNPSNREFVDEKGCELEGPFRRLHTLRSLGLKRWADADAFHLGLVLESCRSYFSVNPYDGWFKGLDTILSETNSSYYDAASHACHLDLIPYATNCKWTELSVKQRRALLESAGDTLGLVLRNSSIRLLILNGISVIENLQRIAGESFEKTAMLDWTLPRRNSSGVIGFSYSGRIQNIMGVELRRPVRILGFNHNIQSSFGVTTKVKVAITRWVGEAARGVIP